jgi:hypothetical protein
MAKAVDICASSAFLKRIGGWDQRFESASLQRRVACEPDLLRVLVQTNAGLEIDNGTIVTNFGAVSVGGNVQIQNCNEVDVDNPRSRAMWSL